jgi:predicted regulator of Ras-like GTPase activity (Roadblock/LC7/MglB family)
MALVGNLRDLKLPNLIQLNCMERNTAKLTVEHAGKYGTIYFQEGQIAHAEYDPDIGEQALYRMLRLSEGKFKVENGVRPPLISISTNWNNLLLEGLHQLDTIEIEDDSKEVRLLSMIMNVRGVKRAWIIDKKGRTVKGEAGSERESALQALIYHEAELLGRLLKLDKPGYISLVSKIKRTIVKETDKKMVIIDIEPKYQLETVMPFIDKVMQ